MDKHRELKAHMQKWVDRLDRNGNGVLDKDEFQQRYARLDPAGASQDRKRDTVLFTVSTQFAISSNVDGNQPRIRNNCT